MTAELFNTYEVLFLLNESHETVVNSLAKAGHLKLHNHPVSPMSTKRRENVYLLADVEEYAGRKFSGNEIVRARTLGKQRREARVEADRLRRERKPLVEAPVSEIRPPAQASSGRSAPPVEAPAEPEIELFGADHHEEIERIVRAAFPRLGGARREYFVDYLRGQIAKLELCDAEVAVLNHLSTQYA